MKIKIYTYLCIVMMSLSVGCATSGKSHKSSPVGVEYDLGFANEERLIEETPKDEILPNLIVKVFFREKDVRSVFGSLTSKTGIPIIIMDDDINGNISIDAEKGLSLSVILDIIAAKIKCAYVYKEGTIFIYNANSKALMDIELVTTSLLARDVLQSFSPESLKDLKKYISVSGKLEESHKLIVYAPPAERKAIDKILSIVNSKKDTFLMQVIVIAEKKDWMREVGIDLLREIGIEANATFSFGDVMSSLVTHGYSLKTALKMASNKGEAIIRTEKVLVTLDGVPVQSNIIEEEYFRMTAGVNDLYQSSLIKAVSADSFEKLCPHILYDDKTGEKYFLLEYDIQSAIQGEKNSDGLPLNTIRRSNGSCYAYNDDLIFLTKMNGSIETGVSGIFFKKKKQESVMFYFYVDLKTVRKVRMQMEKPEEEEKGKKKGEGTEKKEKKKDGSSSLKNNN